MEGVQHDELQHVWTRIFDYKARNMHVLERYLYTWLGLPLIGLYKQNVI